MSWFRLYDEVVDDPKVQMLPLHLFRAWINCLCIAKKHNGVLPEMREVGYRLHLTEGRAATLVQQLIDAELFEKSNGQIIPHNWNGRQFQSDRSTDRVKQFRERHKQHPRNVSCNETETHQNRTETETEQNREIHMSAKADFEEFWKVSTQRGSKKDALAVWEKLKPDGNLRLAIWDGMAKWQNSEQWQDETKQPHLHRWLKRRGWEEVVPRASSLGLKAESIDRSPVSAQDIAEMERFVRGASS